MMNSKKGNNLIIIEDGHITSYSLDDKNIWELGRPSEDNRPDIKLRSTTVSRKHGKFQNMDGVWFYIDYNGKNGTVYNKKHINPGLNGKIKPVMLEDGDIFVFGGGEKEIINYKTIFGLYITTEFNESWRVVDSKGYNQIKLVYNDKVTMLNQPEKGTVIEKEDGVAIYMGDLTYLIGKMEMISH